MFVKEYKVEVHRKIAEGALVRTNPSDSDFYVKNKIKKNVELINKQHRAIIYNIEVKKKVVTIYTNTLNIKITSKFFEKIPLYNYITVEQKDVEDIKQSLSDSSSPYLLETIGGVNYLYFNNESQEYRGHLVKKVLEASNRFLLSPTIKVRKVKDRFKIDISTTEILSIELVSPFLFEPRVIKNLIEFSECIYKVGNIVKHLMLKTFDIYEKTEVVQKDISLENHLKYETKDPILELVEEVSLNNQFSKIVYKTFKSNLQFDSKVFETIYINLTENETQLSYSSLKTNDSILSISNTSLIDFIETNPYVHNHRYSTQGEVYSLMLKDEKEKYGLNENILFGNQKVVCDLRKIVVREEDYLRVGSTKIVQQKVGITYDIPFKQDIEDLNVFHKDNFEKLNQEINKIVNEALLNIKQSDPYHITKKVV